MGMGATAMKVIFVVLACAVACSGLPMSTKEVSALKDFSNQAGKVNKELALASADLKEMRADFKADEKAGGKDLLKVSKKTDKVGDKLPVMFDKETAKLEPLTKNQVLAQSSAGKKMVANVKHMNTEFAAVEKDSKYLTKDFKEHGKELAKMGETKSAPKWYFNDERVLSDVSKQMDGIVVDNNALKGLADGQLAQQKH